MLFAGLTLPVIENPAYILGKTADGCLGWVPTSRCAPTDCSPCSNFTANISGMDPESDCTIGDAEFTMARGAGDSCIWTGTVAGGAEGDCSYSTDLEWTAGGWVLTMSTAGCYGHTASVYTSAARTGNSTCPPTGACSLTLTSGTCDAGPFPPSR